MNEIKQCKFLDDSFSSDVLRGMADFGRVYGQAKNTLYGNGEAAFSQSAQAKSSYDAAKEASGLQIPTGVIGNAVKKMSSGFDAVTGVLSVFEGVNKDHAECNFSYSNTMTEIFSSVAKISSAAGVGIGVAGLVASAPLWVGATVTIAAGAAAGYGMGKLIEAVKE